MFERKAFPYFKDTNENVEYIMYTKKNFGIIHSRFILVHSVSCRGTLQQDYIFIIYIYVYKIKLQSVSLKSSFCHFLNLRGKVCRENDIYLFFINLCILRCRVR